MGSGRGSLGISTGTKAGNELAAAVIVSSENHSPQF